ncbi:acyltransferase [Pseudanabaena sp. FACHB-1998]|uniref:acyltransferase family protein n=1 Tax=Pseudanabaena sp. FACHB-1998 TaxID=2692858 RepID=UPI001680D7E5|nr:acyltransferase [Pseudanabaena sp. FACHB-1998]MBD2178590.1 acyltransferase [Pseudanabaena sp. FACHB-1998]
MNKISVINGIRGISALWVVISHCCILGGYTGYNPNAKVAVDIFMMISGFLMMYTSDYIDIKEPFENKNNWIRFYLRRFFRVSPAYYLALIVAIFLVDYFVPSFRELALLNNNTVLASIPVDFSAWNILLHITYTFGFFPKQSFSTLLPDWSLSLEMQFYLIFPIIFLFFKKTRSLIKITLFTICILLLSVISKKYFIPHFLEPSLIFYQMPIFLIGIFIYLGTSKLTVFKKQRIVFLVSALLLCIYAILTKDKRDNFYLLFASVLLTICCLENFFSQRINHFFDNKFFKTLSDLSYSVYLFHMFFLSIIGAYIERNLYALGYSPNQCVIIIVFTIIPLTYVTAYFLYKYIELPGIRLGKILIKKFK